MNPERLLALYDRVADAPDAVSRLRRFILDLAVRGKLVPQAPQDEPASELLKRIAKEKTRRVKAGEVKKFEANADPCGGKHGIIMPRGWSITTLQAICISITDGDHLPPPKADTGIPFLVIGNVRSQRIDFQQTRFVPEWYYEALDPIRRPKCGDLLYTLVGSYGIPVIVRDDQPFCVQRHIGILRPSDLIDVKFLARAMESRLAFDQATACATGIAQKTVPLSGLRKLLVPLPPLAEQRRIVAKVDELMALCDQLEEARKEREESRDRLASASLTRLNAPDPDPTLFTNDARFALGNLLALTTRPDQIKQLRQTILNLAVRGKLVPQDPQDQGVSDLIAWIRNKKSQLIKRGEIRDVRPKKRGDLDRFQHIPNSWSAVQLGDTCTLVTSGSRGWAEHYVKEGAGFIRAQNIRFGRLRLDDLAFVKPPSNSEGSRTQVSQGDLLIVITGAGVTNPARLDQDLGEAYVSQHVGLVRPADTRISEWLLLCLMADAGGRAELLDCAYGAGKPGLNLDNIRSLTIPLPPLTEQGRIIARVNELMALCDRLEAGLTVAADTRRKLLDALLAEALEPPTGALEAAE